jgi:hypothetical protein
MSAWRRQPRRDDDARGVGRPLHYNRAHLLASALERLTRQRNRTPFEVVVVDNNSTDFNTAAVQEAMRRRDNVRYLFESRQGLASARNARIQAVRAPIVAFTDDDVRVAEAGWRGWLAFYGEQIVEQLRFEWRSDRRPRALVAGARVLLALPARALDARRQEAWPHDPRTGGDSAGGQPLCPVTRDAPRARLKPPRRSCARRARRAVGVPTAPRQRRTRASARTVPPRAAAP